VSNPHRGRSEADCVRDVYAGAATRAYRRDVRSHGSEDDALRDRVWAACIAVAAAGRLDPHDIDRAETRRDLPGRGGLLATTR